MATTSRRSEMTDTTSDEPEIVTRDGVEIETYTDDYGFTVKEQVPLRVWLDVEGGRSYDEYIHIVSEPEERRLVCYRTVNDGFPSVRLKTVIEDVRIRMSNLESGHDEVSHWYITSGNAKTLMTALNAFLLEGGEDLRLTYYEDNGKTMYNGENVGEESLYIRYTSTGGVNREALINSTHTCETHKIGRFEPLVEDDDA